MLLLCLVSAKERDDRGDRRDRDRHRDRRRRSRSRDRDRRERSRSPHRDRGRRGDKQDASKGDKDKGDDLVVDPKKQEEAIKSRYLGGFLTFFHEFSERNGLKSLNVVF